MDKQVAGGARSVAQKAPWATFANLVALGAFFCVPLILLSLVFFLQYTRRQIAEVVSLTDICYVAFRLQKQQALSHKFAPCDEVTAIREAMGNRYAYTEDAGEAVIRFNVRGQLVERRVFLRDKALAKARSDYVIWIAKMDSPAQSITVIEGPSHALRPVAYAWWLLVGTSSTALGIVLVRLLTTLASWLKKRLFE
ncbi:MULTISPECIES: hypothetical protein [unclassified Chelatococcus]|uniref:hypothetical protein n=1 Tax=unclassified Chelatococcus TaxID=2638111 RepID=UPI001BCE2482|nr:MULTISPECIES: hypothetical protein [unclassified Chelatococcus]MBS7696382.1 hypothetical protein [Chelatococcus sp. YT9]MBX3556992.1 hypothetical protein [Chelatococcus sp.]